MLWQSDNQVMEIELEQLRVDLKESREQMEELTKQMEAVQEASSRQAQEHTEVLEALHGEKAELESRISSAEVVLKAEPVA